MRLKMLQSTSSPGIRRQTKEVCGSIEGMPTKRGSFTVTSGYIVNLRNMSRPPLTLPTLVLALSRVLTKGRWRSGWKASLPITPSKRSKRRLLASPGIDLCAEQFTLIRSRACLLTFVAEQQAVASTVVPSSTVSRAIHFGLRALQWDMRLTKRPFQAGQYFHLANGTPSPNVARPMRNFSAWYVISGCLSTRRCSGGPS